MLIARAVFFVSCGSPLSSRLSTASNMVKHLAFHRLPCIEIGKLLPDAAVVYDWRVSMRSGSLPSLGSASKLRSSHDRAASLFGGPISPCASSTRGLPRPESKLCFVYRVYSSTSSSDYTKFVD
ncbi:hypothetical protein GALMADRAFT_1141068 [Galerina marginata CBS 339.88]|uniref:Uncharacterized protein n=1 Tax=Galerina marginata (strain CBS 339.88) TaxID=685588 RepID=A0A067SGD4_GALM3|nr:hypothetical protein GALMADRAFT_1141068 [Galerina marginata CBS 339.88]